MSVMRKVILSFSSLLLLALSLGAQSVPPEGSTTTILVTAEMGGGFAGGSITARQVVPRGTITSPRSFFFDSSGNVTMTLVGGTWQFTFCNTSGVCFNSQGAFSSGNFDITAIFTSSISSGGGGTPAPPDACLQINKGGSFGTASNLCLDSSTSPTTLTEPDILNLTANAILAGPNPYIDFTSSIYGGRSGVINTTGTGSGTALAVGTSAFATGNGITIVGAGAAPVIAAPTGLTVTPSIAAGLTTPDAPTVAGAAGASTYNYRLFAIDISGGVTVPTATVSTTTGNAALGQTTYAISTWSLTGTTLTIVTSATNALVQNSVVHITGTSNNALAEGWYPISSITNGTTFVINNVPQFSNGTTAGTGGNAVTFFANHLSWTASTGGSGTTLPYEYGICAQRPGDGSFHLVAMSFPSTLYAGGVTSTVFNDYGTALTSNPILPYYLSDANCTAGAAQNRLFTTTVASGGGTGTLTLASPMTNSVAGAVVRLDNAPALNAAAAAAKANGAAGVSVYIPATPVSGSFTINSVVILPGNLSIWQVGNLTLNQPLIVSPSTNWTGLFGIQGATSFAFNGAPLIICNSYPSVYVSGAGAQSNGADTYYNLAFQNQSQNGLLMVVDAAWGQIWDRVNFVTGQNNSDNMGIALMIRPGAAQYKAHNSVFNGGPNQVTDQTWAPLVYGDPGNFGNAGPMDFDNNMYNRRGVYILDNGGTSQAYNFHGFYRQGGITPMLTVQNTNGNVGGQVNIDLIQHDTENEAALAVLCGVGCAPGFSNNTGMVFKVGFSSAPSNDGGTIPPNITGGGNAQPTITVDAVSAGSSNGPTQPGWFFNGADTYNIATGVRVNLLGINTPSSAYNLDVNGTQNVAQYIDFAQIGTPANPLSGKCRLFFSTPLLALAGINSSGASCLNGGGGGSSSLPNNQIFVGNASNVAAPQPMSLDANIINTGAVTVIGTNGALIPASATLTATNSLKQIIAATLPSAQIYVGSAGNLPVALSPTGDVTISNTGVFTLASVGTPGACGSATQFCMPTFDAKGREVSVSTALAGVPINSTLGTSPYTMQTSDRVSLLNTNPGSTFTINLFNPATTGFGSNMTTAFRNYGTADYTLTAPGGVNLNTVTAGSLRVPGNWVGFLWSDTNLWLSRLPSFEAFPSCGDSTHAIGFAPASTPPFFCQAISNSASAGGSNGQLQYNNATALGGIAGWTTNGTTSLVGGASAIFDTHLMSATNFFLPGSLSTGLCRVTTSTGAVSCGEISGDGTTSGSNALTLATVNANTGSQTPATITVNAKGLVTALLSIPDVTTTVGTTAIGANSCTSATTVTMTGLTSTMTFSFTPNADVSGITGWGSAGGLVVDAWPTTNTLNYKVCNQTGSSITPSASVTFNVSAR